MAPNPPHPSSASMSRSRTSSDDVQSAADAMLHASVTRHPSLSSSIIILSSAKPHSSSKKPSKSKTVPKSSHSSSASVSRSRTSRDDVQSTADAMLHVSATRHPLSSSSATLNSSTKPHSSSKKPSKSSKASISSRRVSSSARPIEASPLPSSSSVSASATSSSTREKLRLAESECDKMRLLASRLKHEGEFGPSAAEAELRVLKLKYDAVKVKAKTPTLNTAKLFKAACSTDLLFLIDTTGSMAPYIDAAKNQVKSIVDDIKLTFFNEADLRIAVVGYKDHEDLDNIQFIDFTPNADRVRSFLNELYAIGGGDAPEDVLGGIQQALKATWKHETRCIIHIADAPPHGRTLHDLGDESDTYASPGSEPHHLTHEVLLKQIIGLKINYALLRINRSTDRMAFTFFETYAMTSPDCKLHKNNTYHRQACDKSVVLHRGSRSKTFSNYSFKVAPLFEEVELGTKYSALRHLVVKSVTTLASRTASRMSASVTRVTKIGPIKNLSSHLTTIKEAEDDIDVELEATPPQWNMPGWLDKTLMVEAFSTDVLVHGASTLDDLMAHDDNFKISTTDLTIHKRSRPFAQGTSRVAAYAQTAASTSRLVVKSYKRDGKELAHLADDMRCQALCKAFALEFNALVGEKYSIDFIMATCLKPKSGIALGEKCMSLEPFIHGTYVKYNSNGGYVNEENRSDPFSQAAQAFSHFTFERSQGRFLVSDLQGVGHILTDPAIQTKDPERFKLVDPNLGEAGFKFFFASHKCNSICHKLKLKSNAMMINSGKYEFRKQWLGKSEIKNMMACCSNKLCSRIVRVATARKSGEFPGYRWCGTCWPQLLSSVVKLICVASGPIHEFDVSKFFYESQGQTMPRKCPKHRTSADSISRTAMGGDKSKGSA